MKHSLLGRTLWQKSNQFHPVLWDWTEYGLGYYPIHNKKYGILKRKSQYTFKEQHRHMHLSNRW